MKDLQYQVLLVPTEEECIRWEDFLSKSEKPLIFGHISPDGDSVGSVLALTHILRARGKRSVACMAGRIPTSQSWLPDCNDILEVVDEKCPEALDKAFETSDLFICCDFNTPSRTGKVLEEKIKMALKTDPRPIIGIDHHVEPSPDFDFIISKPQAAATCEVITRILLQKEVFSNRLSEITPTVATCLLMGIITDTGLFNHSSSYPEIFETTAELLRRGADKATIINKVYHSDSLNRFNLEGYVRHNKITFDNALKTGYFSLSLQEQDDFSLIPGDTEGLVNIPLDVEDIEISAFFKETLYEGIKISLRSKGNIAINDIARDQFNGGGHKFAAGAEFYGSMEEAISKFLEFLKNNKLHEIQALNKDDNRQ